MTVRLSDAGEVRLVLLELPALKVSAELPQSHGQRHESPSNQLPIFMRPMHASEGLESLDQG